VSLGKLQNTAAERQALKPRRDHPSGIYFVGNLYVTYYGVVLTCYP
jgi:hypothetical protein